MYSLWIGGKKIYSLEQLKDNFDLTSVELYYCGGGLARWLRLCGEADIADKIEKIDTSFDISEQLAEIFGQPKPIKKTQSNSSADVSAPKEPVEASSSFSFEVPKQENSFRIGGGLNSFSPELIPFSSFEMSSSFGGSSFTWTLFYTGSGASFSLEAASLLTTSFNFFSTSFMTSSFHQYEYEFETGGSFSGLGSFKLGSFSFASGSFTSSAGSFNTTELEPEACGSDRLISESVNNKAEAPLPSPREKILQNFLACPLNRFGYGLHLI